MEVAPFDPRDQAVEFHHPAYRVFLWHRGSAEDAGWSCEEWQLTGGDVIEALAWVSDHAADRIWSLWAAAPVGESDITVVRLQGRDPT